MSIIIKTTKNNHKWHKMTEFSISIANIVSYVLRPKRKQTNYTFFIRNDKYYEIFASSTCLGALVLICYFRLCVFFIIIGNKSLCWIFFFGFYFRVLFHFVSNVYFVNFGRASIGNILHMKFQNIHIQYT